ncbi:heme biosynthesis HemY N-terminal domain-containing protein [Pelagibaculum spongiae]|uniref:HemY N-terminal domain-containing protein n=1 Tax=Pelagibaculum spongiae TaxID=2080658 RepID=A0A2V1GZF3_9GAMM|nr:heme biosynthesis HemY N-terminal domain-containing protein [Pelagibaculum spongiae]PVZ70334.1 hypothetical protein DC094_06990 [Pelagibaculum spongiae]
MIKLLFYILLLAVAITAGVLSADAPGYLMLVMAGKSIQMPIWLAVCGSLSIFFLLYFTVRISSRLIGALSGDGLFGKVKSRSARKKTARGLVLLTEGNWAKSEKMLTAAAEKTSKPLLNYLAAAKAAQEQNASDRRDEYLKKAFESESGAKVAVMVTKAQMQYDAGQLEQSLATLQELRTSHPKHGHVLKLLMKVADSLQDWELLMSLLPDLRKQKVVSADDLLIVEQHALTGLLEQAGEQKNAEQALKIWKKLPSARRQENKLVRLYAETLLQLGKLQDAEQLIRQSLNHSWSDRLVALYSRTEAKKPKEQVKHAEAWLKKRPDSHALLLTLARICQKEKLWGKARNYYESCISLSPDSAIYADLSRLLEALGEQKAADECAHKGLKLMAGSDSNLPLPEQQVAVAS